MNDYETIRTRLKNLTPHIESLSKAGGSLGLSIGVLHHGKTIHTSHFGQRTTSFPTPPDDDTVYYVASLTKAVTAAAVALLVEEDGLLQWDTPIVEYLPEFATLRDDEISQHATLVDFLSHRTGLARGSALWVQRRQEFMMPKSETVNVVAHLPSSVPFRTGGFVYNNWGYGLVEAVIERVTGRSFGTFVTERIFEPLGLKRTTFGSPTSVFSVSGGDDDDDDDDDSNVTSANTNWSDGSICSLKLPPQSDETGLVAAGGLKASLSDLLCLYASLLSRYALERDGDGQRPPPGCPFRGMKTLFEPKMQVSSSEDVDRHGYASGWFRTVLPHTLGTIGFNTIYLDADDMPVIGTGSPGTIVLHHHGSLLGTLSSVHLIPETETAIVVLVNTLGFSDVSDWVGQLILQNVIGEPPHDYLYWNEKAKAAHFKKYADLKDLLERDRVANPKIRDLNVYCGRYLNRARNFVLDISVSSSTRDDHGRGGQSLKMKVQQMDTVVYELFPYADDIFYWPCDRDTEMCIEMMYPWTWEGVHKISFDVVDGDGAEMAMSLSWGHDASVRPEVFMRET